MFKLIIGLFALFGILVCVFVLQSVLVEVRMESHRAGVFVLYVGGIAISTWLAFGATNGIISHITNTNPFHANIISLVAALILVALSHVITPVCVKAAIDRNPFYTIDQQLDELQSKSLEVSFKISRMEKQQREFKELLEKNEELISYYKKSAKKAISSDDESKARYFLEQKQQLERANTYLKKAYMPTPETLIQLQEMHTQLTNDILLLKTHRRIIEIGVSKDKAQTDKLILDDMESNIRRTLDEVQAMSELAGRMPTEAEALSEKYQ